MLSRSHGCSVAYANCEMRFPHMERLYLGAATPTDLYELADACQGLCSERDFANRIAVMLGGPLAMPAPGVESSVLRKLVYHEEQKFQRRDDTKRVIDIRNQSVKDSIGKDGTRILVLGLSRVEERSNGRLQMSRSKSPQLCSSLTLMRRYQARWSLQGLDGPLPRGPTVVHRLSLLRLAFKMHLTTGVCRQSDPYINLHQLRMQTKGSLWF